jgi:proteasome lid subunit RPN8/RPN11
MNLHLFFKTDSLFDPGARHMAPMEDHLLLPESIERPPEETDMPRRRKPKSSPAPAAEDQLELWAMKITQSALHDMREYLLPRKPEAAGMLLGPTKDDLLVTHFVPDAEGNGTGASFEINATSLNDVLRVAKAAGLDCKGLAHSHPAGIVQPSCGDVRYLERLFRLPANSETQQCFMPIVCDRRVYPYVYAHGRVWHAELILI